MPQKSVIPEERGHNSKEFMWNLVEHESSAAVWW